MRGKPAFVLIVPLFAFSGCGGGGNPQGPDRTPTPTPTTTVVKACIAPPANGGIVIVGQNITLDGSCSTPAPTASGVTYTWDPGDGRAVKTGSATMTDTYPKSGKYSASLTVAQGSTSDKVSTQVRVQIDCLQPASNGPNVISVDPSRLCLNSGDAPTTLQVFITGSGIVFTESQFRLEGAAFEITSNECPGKSGGSGLFPGDKCDVLIKSTCTEGTTGRLSIGGSGTIPNRYNVNLTCNP
jgi:PKD domain